MVDAVVAIRHNTETLRLENISFTSSLANRLRERASRVLLKGCRRGLGEETRWIGDISNTIFSAIKEVFPVPSILCGSRRIVFLTPIAVTHPLFTSAESLSKEIGGHRSYGILISGEREDQYTLIIKGGDLYNTEGIVSARRRILNGQIPGSSDLKSSEREFDSAVRLQERALNLLGRFTFSAIPISVRRIDRCPVSTGELSSVSKFLDSTAYPLELRDNSSHKGRVKLSDLLCGERVKDFLDYSHPSTFTRIAVLIYDLVKLVVRWCFWKPWIA